MRIMLYGATSTLVLATFVGIYLAMTYGPNALFFGITFGSSVLAYMAYRLVRLMNKNGR